MANLKEIKGRINSVKGTLKITSAMQMISSAKLHSALNVIEALLPYESGLHGLLDRVKSHPAMRPVLERWTAGTDGGRTAVVVVTSNQTLCGSFNANVLKAFAGGGFDRETTDVYAVGKVGMKALRKAGYNVIDCCRLAQKSDYDSSVSLAGNLSGQFLEGRVSKVVLVYTHLVTRAVQKVVTENYLPLDMDCGDGGGTSLAEDLILQPSVEEMAEPLLRKVLRLKFHAMLADAAAAEHASRMLAMQLASDNAGQLIGELSLQYNKLRQQAITNEILDLVGGQAQK